MSRLHRGLFRSVIPFAGALLAAGCDSTTITDQSFGAVVTLVDSGPALSTARTFVLPDTVIRLSTTGTAVGPEVADTLIAEIRAHFLALGWTELTDTLTSHPDVVVLVAASTRIETGVAYTGWWASLLVSTVGAIVLLWVWGMIRGRQSV